MAEETSDTNVTVTGGNAEGSSASAANAESTSARATASDAQIAQAIDAYLPTLTRGQPGTWDRNRVNIKQNSDNTYIVTTVFGQKGAGGGYVSLHLVQDKDGSWYVDKTLTDTQAGIDPTKQDYRPIQAQLLATRQFW